MTDESEPQPLPVAPAGDHVLLKVPIEHGTQKSPLIVKDAPAKPGEVLMEEEVFATWAATSGLIFLFGTQLSARSAVKIDVRVQLDLISIAIALVVLLWASLSYYGVIPMNCRSGILAIILLFLVAFYIYVMVLVGNKKL